MGDKRPQLSTEALTTLPPAWQQEGVGMFERETEIVPYGNTPFISVDCFNSGLPWVVFSRWSMNAGG